jgi:hypothetical protein
VSNDLTTWYEIISDAIIDALERGVPASNLDGRTVYVTDEVYRELVDEIRVSNWVFWTNNSDLMSMDVISLNITHTVGIFVKKDTLETAIH